MQLRRATMEDMYEMQNCNLRCLPENYNLRFYYYHLLSWPQLLYVQQDYNHKTVGYVLSKIDDEEDAAKKHGHITSLAVLRSHRQLGIASRVMRTTMKEMDTEWGAKFCSLHVRKTNDAALHLYQDTLHFRCANVESGYYLDGEDAYHLKHYFHDENPGLYVDETKHMVHRPVPPVSPSATAASTATVAAVDAARHNDKEDSRKAHDKNTNGKRSKDDAKQTAKERESAMAELLGELQLEDDKGRAGQRGNKSGGGKGKGKAGGGRK